MFCDATRLMLWQHAIVGHPACFCITEQSIEILAFCLQGDSGRIGLTGAPGQKGEKVWHSWTWTCGGFYFYMPNLKSSQTGINNVSPIILQGLGGVPGIDGLSGDKGDKVRNFFFSVCLQHMQICMFSSVCFFFFLNRVQQDQLVIQACQA